MRKKQLKKRLTINKVTVSQLNNMTMNDLRGGLSGFETNCGYTNCGYGCFSLPDECNTRDISCYYCGPVPKISLLCPTYIECI